LTDVIVVEGLWKTFRLAHYRPKSIKHAILNLRRIRYDEVIALRDVSFRVKRGESVAVIGRNGSGKSTLLATLCRVYRPTRGSVHVEGRIAPMLELGGGFHPDLTGEENAYIMCAMMGLDARATEERLPDIVKFAELEEFIDAPVRTYSSGMVMRLGFSIAVQIEPDVLLVDEVLAVGDEHFQHKCLRKIQEYQQRGKTVFFVSHDMNAVRRVTVRTLWLHNGTVRRDGPTEEVVEEYLRVTAEEEKET
jgi:ABC-2 type transport system ATP-binding protein